MSIPKAIWFLLLVVGSHAYGYGRTGKKSRFPFLIPVMMNREYFQRFHPGLAVEGGSRSMDRKSHGKYSRRHTNYRALNQDDVGNDYYENQYEDPTNPYDAGPLEPRSNCYDGVEEQPSKPPRDFRRYRSLRSPDYGYQYYNDQPYDREY